ncbi:MAG: hypothetical protein RR405_00195 [Clostridia bacterium]
MALEEAKNTYATTVFADQYLAEHLMPFNALRVHWSVLTDDEKSGYLRASLQEIDRLPFVGRKRLVGQPLAFPRFRGNGGGFTPAYMSVFVGETEDIPTCTKEAQVENALAILLREISATSDKQFMTMQSLGSVKNTKYNKREAGDLGFGDDLTGGGAITKKCPLTSQKAYDLLRGWLGGIAVC